MSYSDRRLIIGFLPLRAPAIPQVHRHPCGPVKPRSLFPCAIRGRASTSSYADPRPRYCRAAHVGGLREARALGDRPIWIPRNSSIPRATYLTYIYIYTCAEVLLAGGRKEKRPGTRRNNYHDGRWLRVSSGEKQREPQSVAAGLNF